MGVLDFNGVSVYHAELYLRKAAPGEATAGGSEVLCIRDDSKNGTGVRAGLHAPGTDIQKPPPDWELLPKGTLRTLDHGWQIIVPMRSRKENSQLPESWRVLTVYWGTKVGPAGGEVDGEAWEPAILPKPNKRAKRALAAGGVFENAPAPPGEEEEANERRDKKDRKREKKERKEREKREQEEREAQERAQREREERKREKKTKKAAKRARDVSEMPEPEDDDEEELRQQRKREKKERKNKKREEEEAIREREQQEIDEAAKAARAKRR